MNENELESLRRSLTKKFTFDCFESLDKFKTLPVNQLFPILKKLQKQQYDNNYRFFFYTFTEINHYQIFYLQQILKTLEIPNWFVCVITDEKSIIDVLKSAASTYTPDQSPIQNFIIKAKKKQISSLNHETNFNIPNSICINPWTHLFLNSDGSAKPCCIYKDNNAELNINSISIEQIVNSTKFTDLRKDLLSGKKPEACSVCWYEEEKGKKSKRIRDNLFLKNELFQLDWNQDTQLTSICIKLGNTCNLACRICGPDYSSTWYNEIKSNHKLLNFYDNNHCNTGWINNKDSKFWEDLKKHTHTVKFIQFEGGEPLLVKRHFEFLEHLIEANFADGIELYYNTNGSIFPESTIDTLNQFKSVHFTLSIDNLYEKFEYERYGTTWDQVDKNIQKFAKLDKSKYFVGIFCSLSLLNVADAYNLYCFFKPYNWPVEFNIVYNPEEMNMNILTDEAKKYTIAKLSNSVYKDFDEKIKPVIQHLITNTDTRLINKFLERTQSLDATRNQKFEDYYPELYTLLRKINHGKTI